MCVLFRLLVVLALAGPVVANQVETEVNSDGNIISEPANVNLGEWDTVEEFWYRVIMSASPIGYMHVATTSNGTHLRSSEVMQITVRRGGTDLSTMYVETTVLETEAGETLHMSVAQKVAQQAVSMTYAFGEDIVSVTSSSAGSTYKSELPRPDPSSYISRIQAQRVFQQGCQAGDREVTVRMIRPELGMKVVGVTRTFKDPEDDEAAEPTMWHTVITGVPIDVLEGYSADCMKLVVSEMESPFGALRCELTDLEEVQQLIAAAAGGTLDRSGMPEVVDSASVVLSRDYPELVRARRAHFRVSHQAHGVLELDSSGYQRVVPVEPGVLHEVDVFLDLDKPSPRLTSEDPAVYLEASVTIDSNDPLIVKLANAFLAMAGNPKSEFRRADALRRGTRRHITRKDLATGFASASETARSKTGDCTEHGVLLAALLRAVNIPSRVCNGLVYTHSIIDGRRAAVFGWHMWTQALIDDAWVDLDATLDRSFNVGHLLVSTERMSDVSIITASHLQMMAILNHMDMKVISVNGEAPL